MPAARFGASASNRVARFGATSVCTATLTTRPPPSSRQCVDHFLRSPLIQAHAACPAGGHRVAPVRFGKTVVRAEVDSRTQPKVDGPIRNRPTRLRAAIGVSVVHQKGFRM